MGYNVWSMTYGVQCMEYDIWGYNVWSMTDGVQCMEHDIWGTMYGA